MKYYPSNINGTEIVNAITGEKYNNPNLIVGTYDEHKLFRVIDVSGLYDSNGNKLSTHITNVTPNKLFYDSKEQYINYKKLYNQSMEPVITLVD